MLGLHYFMGNIRDKPKDKEVPLIIKRKKAEACKNLQIWKVTESA